MEAILLGLIAFACFILGVIVLVQEPKGGGLSSSFGGAGGGSQMFGVQRTNDFLTQATFGVATLIAVLAIVTNLMMKPKTVAPLDEFQKTEKASTPAKPASGTPLKK